MDIGKNLVIGFLHSINYYKAGKLLYNCPSIYNEVLYSFGATGIIFLGSLIVYTFIISPIMLALFPIAAQTISVVYYVVWIFPIYVIAFILNSFWYSDIAIGAYQQMGFKFGKTKIPLSKRIALEIHRALLVSIYLIQCTLISCIPQLYPVSIIMLSWIYSFYCWEFKWTLNGKTVTQQRKILEQNWAYYCGFGLTFTLSTVYLPGLFSNGIWALLFPVFLLTAIVSDCPEVETGFRLPIFYVPNKVCTYIESSLGKIVA